MLIISSVIEPHAYRVSDDHRCACSAVVLEALSAGCYYLSSERNRYRFGVSPNLNKLLADRRASIPREKIDERVRSEVQKVFSGGSGVERVYFPEKSNEVPDRAALTLVVLAPQHSMQEERKTLPAVEAMTRECGASGRTFKSALLWCVADGPAALHDEARKVLAWEDIQAEEPELRLDEAQKRQLTESVQKARRDLKECVWRSYKHVLLLDKKNEVQGKDLGLVHSSAADTITALILNRLRQDGDLEEAVSPTFLVRNWPPVFKEWSTKAVRNAFFSSPQLPRLTKPDSVKDTIARGVSAGTFAYVGKGPGGRYDPFRFAESLDASEVEISDEMFLVQAEEAKKQIEPPRLAKLVLSPDRVRLEPGKKQAFQARGLDQHGDDIATGPLAWSASGGTVDDQGVFTAGSDGGNFFVTAKAGEVSATALVSIAAVKDTKSDDESNGKGAEPTKDTRVRWSGDIPPQKWMNFYTKVLSKFASSKELHLKVRVQVEVTAPAGVPEQKVEEAKVALRELGLQDDVQVG